jgi:hypothetical protein
MVGKLFQDRGLQSGDIRRVARHIGGLVVVSGLRRHIHIKLHAGTPFRDTDPDHESMFEPVRSTVWSQQDRVNAINGLFTVIFRAVVMFLRAVPGLMAGHFTLLPSTRAESAGKGSNVARMRLLAGHPRMIGWRQAITEPHAAAKARPVSSHAATRPAGRIRCAGAAANRSMALKAGVLESGTLKAVAGSSVPGNGSGIGASAADSRSGIHSAPQRAQRTVRPGFSRSAGTSYAAAQLGQAMCMKARYDGYEPYRGLSRRWQISFGRISFNRHRRREHVSRRDAHGGTRWRSVNSIHAEL